MFLNFKHCSSNTVQINAQIHIFKSDLNHSVTSFELHFVIRNNSWQMEGKPPPLTLLLTRNFKALFVQEVIKKGRRHWESHISAIKSLQNVKGSKHGSFIQYHNL